jgi:urease accessory protein
MSSRSVRIRLALATGLVLLPRAASAHFGAGSTSGFAHGFLHPVGGLDHMLVMVAVGLFAAGLGGRALWAVPLSFVSVMALGGILGMQGVAVPYVEMAIGVSVVVLGLAVAWQAQWSVAAAMALVGAFAVFHGHAHGAEMPADVTGATYAAGFMLATALLHVIGIGLGVAVRQAWAGYAHQAAQLGGIAIAIAGLGLLTGTL